MTTNRIFRLLTASALLLVIAVTLVPRPADATLIKWNFSATFADGGTAMGSFVFDSVAMTFSDALVVSTAGSTYGARSYSSVLFISNSTFVGLLDPSDGPDFNMDPLLQIIPTAAGFGDPTASLASGSISECTINICTTSGMPFEFITMGSLVATSVPEPTSLAIFILGLGLLGASMFRRRLQLA